jgi:hypothetical protein
VRVLSKVAGRNVVLPVHHAAESAEIAFCQVGVIVLVRIGEAVIDPANMGNRPSSALTQTDGSGRVWF